MRADPEREGFPMIRRRAVATSNKSTTNDGRLRTSRRGLIILAAAALAACQTSRPDLPRDTMSIAPKSGENGDLRVTFTRSVFPNEEGYLPPTNVYLQHEVTVVGKGSDIQFGRASVIDGEGTVIPAAAGAFDLEKPPEFAKKTATMTLGTIGTAMVTMFTPIGALLPVSALAGGAYVASETTDADRALSLNDTFTKANVQQAIVYRNTTFSGLLFLPAVANPQAVVLEYQTRDQTSKRLRINLQ